MSPGEQQNTTKCGQWVSAPLRSPQTPNLSAPAKSSYILWEGDAEPWHWEGGAAKHPQLAVPSMRWPSTKDISAMRGVPGRLANC